MRMKLSFQLDDDAPLVLDIVGEHASDVYNAALMIFDGARTVLMTRISDKLEAEFLPDTGDARHK